ncbi:MAG: fibronectin type III domain-containing protein, partial [Spirochaetaceae bacterium]|nr:fibronectin type III domain-containing protein [Spirochaetaceae bacterium]
MKKNCSKLSVILFSILVIFTFTGCPGGTSFFSLEAPQNLSVDNIYSDMIELSWDSQSSISGYVLYISLDDSFESAQALDVSKNNAVAISGFQSSTTYYFRVTAYTYSSESDPSEIVSATTLVGAPTEVTMSFTNNNLSLSWNAVPRATGYICYYGLSSNMEENESDEIL